MPTNRFQFSDDFTLNNGNVGINSATPQTKLDVDGVIKGESLKVTGVSSFTTYEGFLNSNQNIVENTTISGGGRSGSLSGEIIVGTGITVTVASGTTSSQGNIDSLKVYNTFTVPVGGTADRPPKPTPGQLFFNRDFATMEFWDGDRWRQVDNTTQRGRGVFGGGYSAAGTNTGNMEFINIMSLGNGVNFGNMVLSAKYSQSGCSDGKRGLFVGGQNVSDIEYITIASEGNSIDFGDLTGTNGNHCGSLSSSTRGIRGGGYTAPGGINVMDYVEIQTLGAALDFGDLLEGNYGLCGFSSPTRGIFAGGRGADAPLGQTKINVITISSKGNATRFGDCSARHSYTAGFSNSVRGFITGGENPITNTIQYVTIASTGNAQDFGDLSTARNGICSGNSANQVRGISAGGVETEPAASTTIDYTTIASTGNAQDFGELSTRRAFGAACSDSHGGLGGF
jgi:hypothetical protein